MHRRRQTRRGRFQWRTLRNWGIPIALVVGLFWFTNNEEWMERIIPSEPTPDPTVRVIYATPSDVNPTWAYMEAIEATISEVQQWFSGRLDGQTFETLSPVPQHCTLTQPASYYAREGGWDRTIADLQHCASVLYPSRFYAWVIFVDTPFDCEASELGAGWDGVTIMHREDLERMRLRAEEHSGIYDSCTNTYPVEGIPGGVAHALGLPHPPGCEEGLDTCEDGLLMWDGYSIFPDSRLTETEVAALKASRFISPRDP